MNTITLPDNDYNNLYTLSGYSNSVIVTNNTSTPIFLSYSATKPTTDEDAQPVLVGNTVVAANKGIPVWIKGTPSGPILVQQTPDITPFTSIDLPAERYETVGVDQFLGVTLPAEDYVTYTGERYLQVELPVQHYTSGGIDYRRLRVDTGQTGFFRGREARTFFEFNLAPGQVQVLKFVSPVDFILIEQNVSVDSGSLRFQAITGATEVATFNTPLPVIGKNRMTEREAPYYSFLTTITTHAAPVAFGSGVTGGTVTENVRIVAANATAQQQTVSGGGQTERGLPPGTYYLRLHNFGSSGNATGVYTVIWEERS